MKKYFIICPDGSSIFVQPYPMEFCMHCLVKLLDVSDEKFMLMRFAEPHELHLSPSSKYPPCLSIGSERSERGNQTLQSSILPALAPPTD